MTAPQAAKDYAQRNAQIADDLRVQGWSVQEDYFDAALCAALRADLTACDAEGALREAGIGRAAGAAQDEAIRNDRTLWLSPENPAPRDFLAIMDDLRVDLNRALFMGLFEYEAHYAQYEAGGFYRKHIDALHGARNRVVSTVSYLTPDWGVDEGGHLVLYAADDHDREIGRVLPLSGTLAVFLSEDIPHEVLPPARARQSIAGWFRCNASGSGRVDTGG